MFSSWVCLDFVNNNRWINTRHLFITPRKNVMKLLEQGCICLDLVRSTMLAKVDMFYDTRLDDMSTGMVSVTIAKFPSDKSRMGDSVRLTILIVGLDLLPLFVKFGVSGKDER
jgi:hypothetical protein